MNTKSILVAVAAIAFGGIAFGQQVSNDSGLLGKRHFDLGFAYVDTNHSNTDAYSTGAFVNVPVSANIDVGAGYGYSWAEGNSANDVHSLGTSVTFFTKEGAYMKPFVSLGLDYVWPDNNDHFTWAADAGVEFAINSKLAVSVSGGFSDDFRGDIDGNWSGDLSANYWLTKSVAAVAAVSWIEGGHVGYTLGCSFRY